MKTPEFTILLIDGSKNYPDFISPVLISLKDEFTDDADGYIQLHSFEFRTKELYVIIQCLEMNDMGYCTNGGDSSAYELVLEKLLEVLPIMGYEVDKDDLEFVSPDCDIYYNEEANSFTWDK